MKRTLLIIGTMLFISGCNDGGGVSGYIPGGPDSGYKPRPQNPTAEYENAIVEQNKTITGLYSRNAEQVADYIDYRLNEWDEFNPGIGTDISRTDIAAAAVYLTDTELTAEQIAEHFAGKETLFHMAAYVINNALGDRCFGDGADSADCFVSWRDTVPTYFENIANEIRENTTILTADGAVMNTLTGEKLTFILDADGKISGIKMTDADGAHTTDFERWANSFADAENNTATLQHFSYSSLGKEIGLTYSDFGHYSIQTEIFDIDNQTSTNTSDDGLFAGGYESKKINESDIVVPTGGLDFTGSAVARVTSDRGDSPATKIFNGSAGLNIDATDGTVEMTAMFNDWYDVNATKKIGEKDADFTFFNYGGNVYSTDFQFNAETDKRAELTGTIDINYYGPNPETNTPTEATGFATVDEGTGGVKMDMAFGVKR